jgi:hypothetical protein
MSRKELVLLVSRAFALLLITWALVEVTYLPDRLFELFHHLSQRSVLATRDYWSTYDLILTGPLLCECSPCSWPQPCFGDAVQEWKYSSRRSKAIKKHQHRGTPGDSGNRAISLNPPGR